MPLVTTGFLPARITLEDVAGIFFLIFCAIVHRRVSLVVDQPFIDEIFHLRQCQVYCKGDYFNWDNKITTPPGLYVLGTLYARALQLLGMANACDSYGVLRSLNLVGGLFVLPRALRKFRNIDKGQFWTYNVVSQSLMFPYYFLFYTDIWSTIFIVMSLSWAVSRPSSAVRCGVYGFVSLWFRQTNIVWLAFVMSVLIDRKIETQHNEQLSFGARIVKFIQKMVEEWTQLVPFAINFGLFGVFLVVNGGITFGDKENHEINAHIVQVLYCFTFITFFTWPVWLSKRVITRYISFNFQNYGFNLLLNGLLMALIKHIIDNYTVVHPFLLADNRHYTFYIFKKLISHRYSQFISIPLYHFCTWNIITSLNQSKRLSLSPITIITYLGAICLTIIPSPLFEPRYYIVPLIVYRLFIKPSGTQRPKLEFLWLNGINLVIMAVFFKYEFTWISEPTSVQRIIW
ncbi:glycosyltransferase family 59 protein [Suhomyces tanzawaensis NRRL Y-17324]|uniref:Dol-P-Glc:Glc(2)Man(9)GlcNAc(2)-PP-Dol alpha-1,2-glucosyltransferase n=1 Tax=Suhomyces tanzawaensis NRRL Y-17324 TaxID=984487 RepID=A0A1E4SC39_9ASCO|nr:glycosyltransferase family 59 protein [Suhomyces tanzawaensis NRRL Y-17324]ODV77084.1 glycosyltransferase family 59 protein [Suhomyces tanzawaensis NRRL Y-17324]